MVCATYVFVDAPATAEIYALSLHDALPISSTLRAFTGLGAAARLMRALPGVRAPPGRGSIRVVPPPRRRAAPASTPKIGRATSELQSQSNLVCRLLLEKKKDEPKSQRHDPA